MPMIGQLVPDGTYQSYQQRQIQPVTLRDYRGRWLVLAFYPGDFTFICPTELEELSSLYKEFQKMDTEVFGVSTDSVYVHKAWLDTSPSLKSLLRSIFARFPFQTG
jgi:peroxiredoxin (alkyl hydroperoxide reductase subunit C)